MTHLKHTLLAFIAMIPLVLISGSATAGQLHQPADTNSVQQKMETNAGAIILAKGQNNLPKHDRSDCSKA